VSRSEFFRMLILNRLDDIPALKPKRPTDYRELLRLFNKSSNNINQMAKKINTEYRNGFISESTYLRYLNVLVNIRDAFVAGIDKC
ncbi:TPA: plasmid mobilization relaxosome protein MobC, partial [Escherichia coli]|nr:plasmid mobilization relaxosome protein MobC [Escherichia coli]